jgi:hypothetical protein
LWQAIYPKSLTLPSGPSKPVTLKVAAVVVVLSVSGPVVKPVEYPLMIGQPELMAELVEYALVVLVMFEVVEIARPVVMALVVVVMFEPAVIAGPWVMALLVVVMF